jgi:5,10-methylene-tetrahydrofolate dehydrogenase/methenyl tetrahydrofolate cyclohydrolase
MKQFIILSSILSLLYFACGQASHKDEFREGIDEAKKEIANTDFAVSTYAVDSSKYWKVISHITQKQKSGIKSTVITSSFIQDKRIVQDVINDVNKKSDFKGQIITTDLPDEITICYLLTNDQNVNSIYEVSCNKKGKYLIKTLDTTKADVWKKITSTILEKEN